MDKPELASNGLENSRYDTSQSSMRDDKAGDILTDDNVSESVEQDVLEGESNAAIQEYEGSDLAYQKTGEDEELDELMEWLLEMCQEDADRSLARIEKSLARIDPLFEDMEYYKDQEESLKLQGDVVLQSQARAKWRSLEREAVNIYGFLRSKAISGVFGELYLSTPQYARVKTFAEHWYATNPRNYNIHGIR